MFKAVPMFKAAKNHENFRNIFAWCGQDVKCNHWDVICDGDGVPLITAEETAKLIADALNEYFERRKDNV